VKKRGGEKRGKMLSFYERSGKREDKDWETSLHPICRKRKGKKKGFPIPLPVSRKEKGGKKKSVV